MTAGYLNSHWRYHLEVVGGGLEGLSRRLLALAASVCNHILNTTHEQVGLGLGASDAWRFSR
jgi:hypothetical protein